jgi:hypothetical protein
LCKTYRAQGIRVYGATPKPVTFSADEKLIEKARARVRCKGRTLSTAFREWLERYAGSSKGALLERNLEPVS